MGSVATSSGRCAAVGARRGLSAAGFAVFCLIAGSASAQTCRPDAIDIQTEADPVRFQIEIADTEAERAQGLMFRETMPADHGMYFVYDRADQIAFWMKNTPLPLDIIFINRRGVVCGIAANTTPFSEEHIPSGCAAQTVLEVNAGQAAARGIQIGAPVRHGAILDPVWPCE